MGTRERDFSVVSPGWTPLKCQKPKSINSGREQARCAYVRVFVRDEKQNKTYVLHNSSERSSIGRTDSMHTHTCRNNNPGVKRTWYLVYTMVGLVALLACRPRCAGNKKRGRKRWTP